MIPVLKEEHHIGTKHTHTHTLTPPHTPVYISSFVTQRLLLFTTQMNNNKNTLIANKVSGNVAS